MAILGDLHLLFLVGLPVNSPASRLIAILQIRNLRLKESAWLVGPALEPSLSVTVNCGMEGDDMGRVSLGTEGPREFPCHGGAGKHHTLVISPGYPLAVGGASIHLRTRLPEQNDARNRR